MEDDGGVWDGRDRDTLRPNATDQGNGGGGALGRTLDVGTPTWCLSHLCPSLLPCSSAFRVLPSCAGGS